MKKSALNVSVEYAHIYTNNKISKEHELSLNILKKLQAKLENQKQTSSLVILVDDYSFPDPTFDYKKFTLWLSKKGFQPDLIFRESQLIPLCDEVLRKLNNKELYSQLVDYIKTRKYPCSLFIAVWYLLRCGFLEHKSFSKKICASHLINILPISFKPFEDKALEIIASTEFSGVEKQIEYIYIEGRLLA